MVAHYIVPIHSISISVYSIEMSPNYQSSLHYCDIVRNDYAFQTQNDYVLDNFDPENTGVLVGLCPLPSTSVNYCIGAC